MYKLTSLTNDTNVVLRLSDNAYIPMDANNLDYQHYLKWLDGYEYVNGFYEKTSDSNTPEPADETPKE